ncbi:MAG: hypothetical protein M1833_006443 [Piccolia ochrophora]|nr:MAG: hypothetical protein M1833_006443 [Piccolia ochrophora]
MPDEAPAKERPHDHHRFLSKQHWKGKIFSSDQGVARDGNRRTERDHDVDDFLRPTVGLAPPPATPSSPAAKLGRIDTLRAPRWPTATELNQFNSRAGPINHGRQGSTGRSASLQPSKKGLTVKFADAQPEIIGEGGDDAESPPDAISRLRARSHSPQRQHRGDWDNRVATESKSLQVAHRRPLEDQSTIQDLPERGNHFKRKPLKRRPTTGEQLSASPEPPMPASADIPDYGETSVGTPLQEGRFPAEESSAAPAAFVKSVQAKMRAEEGRAFHRGSRQPELLEGEIQIRTSLEDEPPRYDPADAPPVSSQSYFPPSPKYSLRPTPSPQISSADFFPQSSRSASPSLMTPSSLEPGLATSLYMPQPVPPMTLTSHAPKPTWPAPGDDAIEDFSSRTQHLGTIFHLAAESSKPILETPLTEWMRAAIWWFMKGRGELEAVIRNSSSNKDPTYPASQSARQASQAQIDLAKIWWIIQYIVTQHPDVRRYGNGSMNALIKVSRGQGDEETASLIETHQVLIAKMRALATSMKKNDFLPPPPEQGVLTHGLDTTIWVAYPFLTPEICSILSGHFTRSMTLDGSSRTKTINASLPIGDTDEQFSIARMFVNVVLTDEESEAPAVQLPCVLSVLRDRTDWQIKIVIASQSSLVNVSIQPNKRSGPSWDDVRWMSRHSRFVVKLPRGFIFDVECKERDFKALWGFYDQAQKIEANLSPEPNERLIFENTVKTFQCKDSSHSTTAFSREPASRCRVRLFEREVTISEGTGTRKMHHGFRLIVVTSPRMKAVSYTNHSLGMQKAIELGILRGKDSSAALLLKVKESKKQFSLVFTFHQDSERLQFMDLLYGVDLRNDEMVYADLRLRDLSIEPTMQGAEIAKSEKDLFRGFRWQRMRIINKDPINPDQDIGATILSESLRLVGESNAGCVTDRVNIGPGQLRLRLGIGSSANIKVLRRPQSDLTISVIQNQVPEDIPDAISNLLTATQANESVRYFDFDSLQGKFQSSMTGFAVLFDGVASTFAISRRRMVVPIHKKWEASDARIQIVRQDKVTQLVAFFEDFKTGDCMNFQLKGTDVYEIASRSGKPMIRFVDAKFALPKARELEGKEFVCLDMPEYPSEHDDIYIAFDRERGKVPSRNARSLIK